MWDWHNNTAKAPFIVDFNSLVSFKLIKKKQEQFCCLFLFCAFYPNARCNISFSGTRGFQYKRWLWIYYDLEFFYELTTHGFCIFLKNSSELGMDDHTFDLWFVYSALLPLFNYWEGIGFCSL